MDINHYLLLIPYRINESLLSQEETIMNLSKINTVITNHTHILVNNIF